MKRLLEVIPFILLISQLAQLINQTPSISHSIIVIALSILCGYRLFAMEQEKPNYIDLFKQEFEDYKEKRDKELNILKDRHEKAMVHLEAKVKELDSNYAKSTMSQSRGSMRSFEF